LLREEAYFLMRIALVSPPYMAEALVGKTASMKVVLNIIPPLGLAYLAAVLEDNGYEVRIFDCSIGISLSQLMGHLKEYQPDVVGITSTTPAFHDARRTAESVRQTLPEAAIVLGGAHVSAVPQNALSYDCFDVGVIAEGELTMLELVRHIEGDGLSDLTGIAGLVFRRDGEIFLTEPRGYIRDLDTIPFPARHLLPPLSAYSPTPASYRKLPLAVLMTSRGCPYQCTFCDRKVFGNLTRGHSPDRVVAEVEEVLNRYGAREIRFFDDTFTYNKKRIMEMCEKILQKGLRFPWTCLTRVSAVTKELLKKMKEAGCWQVLYGLESGDPHVLASLKKGNTVEQNEQAVRWAQEVGLGVRADFIVGTPAETMESLERTLEFAKRLKLDYAHFNKFVPFAGTELYEELVEQGYEFDISDLPTILDHQATPYVPPSMTAEEFHEFLDRANREFYLRPSHILRRLLRTRTWHELTGQIKGAFAIIRL
jgi:anaerobic magnesium-protoporphyrin IX monomethyl ester cyclase